MSAYPEWYKPEPGEIHARDYPLSPVIETPPGLKPGDWYYKIGVHLLTGAENRGNHHAYFDAINTGGHVKPDGAPWIGKGERIRFFQVAWNEMGQNVSHPSMPIGDKPLNEPACNHPLDANHAYWFTLGSTELAEVNNPAFPAEKVGNIHGNFVERPEDNPGSSLFHQSVLIIFHLVQKVADGEPTPEPEPEPGEVRADFTYAPTSPTVGQRITFANRSVNHVRVAWNIDGNQVGNITSPTLTPNRAGEIEVSLTAVAADGKTSTVSKRITVLTGAIPLPPPDTPIRDVGGIECFAYREAYTVVSKIGGLTAEKPIEGKMTAGYVAIFVDVTKAQALLDRAKAKGDSFFTVFTPTLEESVFNTLYRQETLPNDE